MSENKPSTSGLSNLDLSKLPRGAIGINGAPLGRNARLPSIKGPRDLTLGLTSKRVFTPNIPIRRDKKVPQPKVPASKTNKQVLHQNNQESRSRGRGKKSFVQMPGAVFGEGISNIPKSSTARDFGCTSKPVIQKPVIKYDSHVKIEKFDADDEAELSDQFVDDSDVHKDTDRTMLPVSLPLKNDLSEMHKEESAPVEEEKIEPTHCRVKKEPVAEVEEDYGMELQMLERLRLKPNSNELYLLEFPDFFLRPRKNESNEGLPNETGDVPNSEQPDSTPVASHWYNMKEGRIGKLQFLRNGTSRLVVGKQVFEVTNKEPCTFLQQLISVTTQNGCTDVSLLGNVKHGARVLPTVDTNFSSNPS